MDVVFASCQVHLCDGRGMQEHDILRCMVGVCFLGGSDCSMWLHLGAKG